ncbi:MAG: alpha-hydroxy-acid oxidizing protein, partial [Spirochaetota bacterium]
GVECAGRVPGIGAAGGGGGFRRNIRALRRRLVVPDMLAPLDNVNTGTTLFGIPLDLPVLPAPLSGMRRNLDGVIEEGEYHRLVLAGARLAGTVGCISGDEADGDQGADDLVSPLEDLYGHGIPFFNPYRGRKPTMEGLERAAGAGVKAAGLSIDLKEGFAALATSPGWLAALVRDAPVPLIVKGVCSLKNARQAVEAGARGLVLSNRGGRLLEGLPAGLDLLPRARELFPDLLLVVDGGFRSGEDVFKALALGADLVMIGRPVFIAAAGAGAEGVRFYLHTIRTQLGRAMLLAGAKTVQDITADMTTEDPSS